MIKFLVLLTTLLLSSCATIYEETRGHNLEIFGEIKHLIVIKYVRNRAGKYTKSIEYIPYVLNNKYSCFEASYFPKEHYIITVPRGLSDDLIKILTVKNGEWKIEKSSPYSTFLFEAHQLNKEKIETAHCSYHTLTTHFFNNSYSYTSIKIPKMHMIPDT